MYVLDISLAFVFRVGLFPAGRCHVVSVHFKVIKQEPRCVTFRDVMSGCSWQAERVFSAS